MTLYSSAWGLKWKRSNTFYISVRCCHLPPPWNRRGVRKGWKSFCLHFSKSDSSVISTFPPDYLSLWKSGPCSQPSVLYFTVLGAFQLPSWKLRLPTTGPLSLKDLKLTALTHHTLLYVLVVFVVIKVLWFLTMFGNLLSVRLFVFLWC